MKDTSIKILAAAIATLLIVFVIATINSKRPPNEQIGTNDVQNVINVITNIVEIPVENNTNNVSTNSIGNK